MDNNNRLIKLCGICGIERGYNENHRLDNHLKKCVAEISARYYDAIRDKITARSKYYQENTKYVKKSHNQQIEELIKKVEEVTGAMETLV